MPTPAHTVKSYDAQLTHLREGMAEMADSVCRILSLAGTALVSRDGSLKAEAKTLARSIREQEDKLEQAAITILALRQPQADDLRLVASSFKVAAFLDRMGRLARGIVRRAANMEEALPETLAEKLQGMAKGVGAAVTATLEALEHLSPVPKAQIDSRDDEIDDAYRDIFDAIIADMTKRPESARAGTHAIFIAKNYERLGDYAASLAKVVHYIVTGEKLV